MSNDDKSSVQPASATPETELIDASWDDPSVEPAGFPASEPRTSISQRVTAPPELRPDRQCGLHSGTEQLQGVVLPEIPPLTAPGRISGTDLDDPLIDVAPDLDTDTPSQERIPIADRVTPVHDPPPELLELDPASSRRIGQLQDCPVQDMRERYSVGDFSGALIIAESILETSPGDPDATRYARSCRDVLMQMYSARLGPLDQLVKVAVPSDQIRWLSLDHRAGFMLSLVDGGSSLADLLDICGMPRLDALRILYMLFEQRVIALGRRT
jgi:hypothetical protein